MKKSIVILLALICLLGLSGCNKKSMDYIIEHEPNIKGIVEETDENYILISLESDGEECQVSLDVENKDSMTHFKIGDEVVVYYDGNIAESDPLQINKVYAIVLTTPAERSTNNNS